MYLYPSPLSIRGARIGVRNNKNYGDFGLSLPWSDTRKMLAAAAAQLILAAKKTPLLTVRGHDDATLIMSKPVANVGDASAKAAFWMALAMRVLGLGKESALWKVAQANYSTAAWVTLSVGKSVQNATLVVNVLQAAIEQIEAAAGSRSGEKNIQNILSALRASATKDAVQDAATATLRDAPLTTFTSKVIGGQSVAGAYWDVWWAKHKTKIFVGGALVTALVVWTFRNRNRAAPALTTNPRRRPRFRAR